MFFGFHYVPKQHSLHKMAIALFRKRAPAEAQSQNSEERTREKDAEKAYDAEGRAAGDSSDESFDVGKQIAMEADNAIKYRTCSWPKTAALLFSEYICLAIMSFPWSYSILGLVPGLILTVVIAALVLYTSLITWYALLDAIRAHS